MPNGREDIETAREGTREPVKQKLPGTGTPEPVNKRKSSANSRRATRGETRGSQRQSLEEKLEHICPGQVECDHQHELTGKLSQSEAEKFRNENEADQSKIEIVWNVRDPCVLFYEELSRCDNMGLSDQDGEVLIPIIKQRQNSR